MLQTCIVFEATATRLSTIIVVKRHQCTSEWEDIFVKHCNYKTKDTVTDEIIQFYFWIVETNYNCACAGKLFSPVATVNRPGIKEYRN